MICHPENSVRRSKMHLTGLKPRYPEGCVLPGGLRGALVFLSFQASRGCLNSVACDLFLHLQVHHSNLSFHYHVSLSDSASLSHS